MSAELFTSRYGHPPAVTHFTPGRVNILGEHTDYNGGMVLPSALELGVTLSMGPRQDDRITIVSGAFDDTADRSLSDTASGHWSDYVTGSLSLAAREGLTQGGADIAITTTLPFGAGISSSAAVSVATLSALRTLKGFSMSDSDIAVLARRVENDFIGMPCGIMDQMAVAVAHPGQVLALDTRSLDYDLIDLPDTHYVAVVHSGVFRQLNEGRYKERKEECDIAKAALGTDDLCLITEQQLATLEHMPVPHRRARHCLREHRRTLTAAKALRDGDMEQLGRLMNEGHASIRDDFEITVPTVDELVEDAVSLGALGARQTGGGFGGCIVALVPKADTESWFEKLQSKHPDIKWVA